MSKFNKSIILIKLPRAGLGNKLIVWGHGIKFSESNNLKYYVVGWFDLKIGTFLRKEKRKRLYFDFFKSSKYDFLFFYKIIFFKKKYNPTCFLESNNIVYVFDKLPEFPNYLTKIQTHRDFIREKFYNLIKEKHIKAFQECNHPIIAVHIRRSDFIKNDNFEIGSVCNLQAPLSYFKDKILEIRTKSNSSLPVTIFTDGNYDEVNELFLLDDVQLAKDNLDIVDLLLMANAKYLVMSPGSTFSLWAHFVSRN